MHIKSIPDGTSHATSTDSNKDTSNIIPPSQPNLNPNNAKTQANLGQNLNQNNTIKPPKSDWEWREWLKRKRKGLL